MQVHLIFKDERGNDDEKSKRCNGGVLEDFKQLRLRGKSYRQMRKLRDRNVVQMQTNGNCCWKLHSLSKFRGIEETVYNGLNIVPRVHPRSIKREICT